MNPPRRNLTSSQAAAYLGVSAKALRIYERQGLIVPGRSAAGWRLYGPDDLARASEILCLRRLGLSLAQIVRVWDGELRERFGYRAVIVVGVREDGTVDVMSHARDRADCRVIGDYAQAQFGANLPRAPFQTWFGWGNGGVPLGLTDEQLAQLGNYGRRYVAANTHPDAEARSDG